MMIGLLVAVSELAFQPDEGRQDQAMYRRYLEARVDTGTLEPHWMADGSSFWYAEHGVDGIIIYKVDPAKNERAPLFDLVRLRAAISQAVGHELPGVGLPFAEFSFTAGEKAVRFEINGQPYQLDLDTYRVTRIAAGDGEPSRVQRPARGEMTSPDGRWSALVHSNDLWLRSSVDGRLVRLTDDGADRYDWKLHDQRDDPAPQWSPNGFRIALKRVDSRGVHYLPVMQYLQQEEAVDWVRYAKAGGSIQRTELFIIDVLAKRRIRVDAGDELDHYFQIMGWRPDGSELLFLRMNRLLTRVDLMAADAESGKSRIVLTETSRTFLWGIDINWIRLATLLTDGKQFVWRSEREGWSHLYLYDIDGHLIRRLTTGTFPILGVERMDERNGWVYFLAHGDSRRPYDTHLYRVGLEGGPSMQLTAGQGEHAVEISPSASVFVDRYSSIDRPPIVELRRTDGMLVRVLRRVSSEPAVAAGWTPPEEFVVKAADGLTDLWGVLYKPHDFDPNKKYPVIQYLYAGPPFTTVPRTFFSGPEAVDGRVWGVLGPLANLGFITFVVDGRGTPERGKQFQDVVFGNLGRHEIPDQVAALEQLAAKRAYMDLTRVGIFGHSWGGYFAIRAMLTAPDVYHVGVASAPVTNVYESPEPIEPYLGLPQHNKAAYELASNVRLAGRLTGKLLFIHGTSDVNAPVSATMRMIDALVRAGKPYDLVVLPGHDHNITGLPYWIEAVRRYFENNLRPLRRSS